APGDPEVCRLLATLHLKQGQLACAKAEFQFLSEAAMRAHDYVLAESMLLEYLKVDPGCISLCELLGRLYEQNGDVPAAAVQYGKAMEALIAQPDPEQATLPFELYQKILSLSPSSPLINQYAALFPNAVPAQPINDAEDSGAGGMAAAVAEQVQQAEPASELKGNSLSFRFSESQADFATKKEAKVAQERDRQASTPSKMVFRFAGQAETPAPAEVPAAAESVQEPVGWGQEEGAKVPAEAAPDYDEQYQLGLAYQQMGLPELAAEALLISVNSADHFADSCRLLALCCKEQGRVQEAIDYLERGLASPKPLDGETASLLRYELGLLYEAGGRVEQALQVFSAVPSFRDVREHMARLSDGHGSRAVPLSAQEVLADVQPVAVGHQSSADASAPQKKKRRISYL
ncbi:MAG: tetratricopeptide repeat protein, partial [Nitrospiraceae bacterium]